MSLGLEWLPFSSKMSGDLFFPSVNISRDASNLHFLAFDMNFKRTLYSQFFEVTTNLFRLQMKN